MFCSQCGAELPKDAHFCPGCGGSAAPDASREATASGQPAATDRLAPSGPAAAAAPRAKMALWKKIAIGAVVVVVGFVGLALFLTSGLVTPVEAYLGALKEHTVTAA